MKLDIIKQLYRENLKIIGEIYTDVSEHKTELKAATDAGLAFTTVDELISYMRKYPMDVGDQKNK